QRDVPRRLQPVVIHIVEQQFDNNPAAYAGYLFAQSALLDQDKAMALWDNFSNEKLESDPGYLFMVSLYQNYFDYQPQLEALSTSIDSCQRVYVQALREVFPDKTHYPDANLTLRITYGKVEGMSPKDAVKYRHYTTLDGVIAKYDPEEYDYRIPDRLRELHAAGAYGPYAQGDDLPVAFIASNHTSGGNSGSPVLNGRGELIGLNFDRNWEGTMSDFLYDPNLCRNISVDVRYVLFLLDKYGEVPYLLEEMKLVGGEE
ncbi:MAG: S46 family peptidase, partial [Bacteroidota bacterium]